MVGLRQVDGMALTSRMLPFHHLTLFARWLLVLLLVLLLFTLSRRALEEVGLSSTLLADGPAYRWQLICRSAIVVDYALPGSPDSVSEVCQHYEVLVLP